MLLVQLSPEGDLKYLALTAAGAEFYADQLDDPDLSARDPGYALINLEGDIFQFSKNTSLEKCKDIIASDECQQMLHYVEFLNGKIRDPLQLSTVVKEHGWDERDYKALSKLVHSVHVSHHPVELQDNPALQQACGWTDTPEELLQKAYERYRYPDVTLTELNRRELQAIDRDDIEISATPMRAETIITPSVFGEKPVSFSYLETSPELGILTKKVASLEKQKMSDPRRLARTQLQSNVDCVLKSRLSLPEKEELIESFYDSYIAFETLLVDLYETMRSYTPENNNLDNIKRDVLDAIKQSFTAYSQAVDINDCCQELKIVLDNKKTEASSEVKKLNAKVEHKMFQFFNKKSNPIEIFNAMEKKLKRFDSERAEGLKFTV
jgi:hypothetical protein